MSRLPGDALDFDRHALLQRRGNVDELHRASPPSSPACPTTTYEHIFIDNASTDGTAAGDSPSRQADSRVKAILNSRNFGHIRSPMHAMLQARGDAVITMASDLQDPPELIPAFVREVAGRLQGRGRGQAAIARKRPCHGPVRRSYYRTVGRIADVELIPNFTGFGLYDRSVIEIARRIRRPLSLLSRHGRRHRLPPRRDSLSSKPLRSAASPRTTSTPSMTWRCSASPATPRFRCGWRPWPDSAFRWSAC
jgi:glycosyltransferase involved in cell wall biosynthesis